MRTKERLINQLVVVLVVAQSIIFVLPLAVFGADEMDVVISKPEAEILYKSSDDKIVKSVLIEYFTVSGKFPEVQHDGLDSAIYDLLYLFDSMTSEQSLKTLASLVFYNFGAHQSEIYECLVSRKGDKIKPYFEELLKSGRDECTEIFGPEKPSRTSSCYGNDDYPTFKHRIKEILRKIEKYPTCTDEELWNG